MKWLRCTLKDASNETDVKIDVLVGPDNRILTGVTYFGFWREKDGSYPFAIHGHESACDFGTAAGGPKDRFGVFQIHGHLMHLGAKFVYEGATPNTTWDFEVTHIRDYVLQFDSPA